MSARVLIVESERFLREAIAEILCAAGLDCVECADADIALGLAQEPSIGVVVLDMALPQPRRWVEPELEASPHTSSDAALELLGHLLEARPTLRVIMLCAARDAERVLVALREGACDHLAKPLHDEELVLCVRRALETYSAVSERARLRARLARLVSAVEEFAQQMADARGSDRSALLNRSAAELAAEVLEAGKTSLMLLDEAGTELRVAAAVGGNVEPVQMERRAIGEGVAGQAIQRSRGIVVEDIASDVRFAQHESSDRYASGSFAVARLASDDRPLGVLCATDRAGGDRFGEEDLALLRLLALQVTEFIGDEARANAQRESGRSEPADESDSLSSSDIELMREVCDAVVAEVEPERVVRAALLCLARGLDAAPVSLYLVHPDTGELQMEGECDGGVRSDRGTLAPASGLTGTVFQTGQLVAAPEPQSDPRFDASVDTAEDGTARPFLCVPLKIGGKTVGLFRAFPQDRVRASARTGEVIAAALSAAIRSVLLYRSLLATIDEVALARRQSQRASAPPLPGSQLA